MAAPINRLISCAKSLRLSGLWSAVVPWTELCTRNVHTARKRVLHTLCVNNSTKGKLLTAVGVSVAGGISAAVAGHVMQQPDSVSFVSKVHAAAKENVKPAAKPTRMVRSETDHTGLRLTLYQYQSCPFCCKVRAYLDYHGYSYDVVEVNSVLQTEIKWSNYKKVPILVCHVSDDMFLQLNDSSLIISILESYRLNQEVAVEKLMSYYPSLESTNSRGKSLLEYPNKYFLMYGDKGGEVRDNKDERLWRKWTDEVLVHTLSPNIYRTPAESLQAFHHFSEAGGWPQIFGTMERLIIIYVGAAAMYFVGRMLKKRHHLKDDVRESMYDACCEWTKAVRQSGGMFLGGDRPCLADLAVYGVLSAIEGCTAFDDLKTNTDISQWYNSVKNAVAGNAGSQVTVDSRHAVAIG